MAGDEIVLGSIAVTPWQAQGDAVQSKCWMCSYLQTTIARPGLKVGRM